MKRSETIARWLLTILFVYLFTIGAPWSGVLVWSRYVALGVIAATFTLWALVRWRGGWKWHNTPLDIPIWLWAGAFAISMAANDETWRRSAMALWFMLLYTGVWYVMADLIANRGIRREVFVDAFMLAALVVVLIGYYQIRTLDFDLLNLDFLRPVSTLGNANVLGAFLVILVTLILGRLLAVRNAVARAALALYALASLGLLFMTFSRGAWIGMLAAMGTLVLLEMASRGLTSIDQLRAWLAAHRRLVTGALVVIGPALLIGAVVIVGSLSQGGRSLSRRTYLWEDAIDAFAEKPLTGHSLFTFGQELMRLESMPPTRPHAHAHNLPLHIAAELGLPGLLVFAFTLVVLFRAIKTALATVPERERGATNGAVAAVIGMSVHQLLDMPVMFPLIAVLGMMALVIATLPGEPEAIQAHWRLRLHPLGMIGLWIALLATGVWSTAVYARFDTALRSPFGDDGTGDYRTAAEEIQGAIDADPGMTWYSNQQGFLYGLAAYEGDDSALEPGIAAYARFIETDPQNAVALANMAALQWGGGDSQAALATMQRAAEAAPDAWQLSFGLGLYAEETGDEALAREAYTNALTDNAYLLPEWDSSELRQAIHETVAPEGFNAVLLAWMNGEVTPETDLDALFEAADYEPRSNTRSDVLAALLALAQDGPDAAESAMERAADRAELEPDKAWVAFGRAQLARYHGDDDAADEALNRARKLLTLNYTDLDFRDGVDIAYIQFRRSTIPRQFLPQVFYPSGDPALLRLLAEQLSVIR